MHVMHYDVMFMRCCCVVVMMEELAVEAAAEEEEDSGTERHCDSLIMCIVTTLNAGLRNGGGIGDVLRRPSSTVSPYLSVFYCSFLILRINKTSWQILTSTSCTLFCRSRCSLCASSTTFSSFSPSSSSCVAGAAVLCARRLRPSLLLHRHHHRA